MKWEGKYYFEIGLPFGLSRSCRNWEEYSVALHQLIEASRTADDLDHYIDDFIIISLYNTTRAHEQIRDILLLSEQLGVPWATDKTEIGKTTIIYLGIQINVVTRTLSLDHSRLQYMNELLLLWVHKFTCTKTELMSLTGILSFASKCVRSGRTFLRRLIDHQSQWQQLPDHMQLEIPETIRLDVIWWSTFINKWNGQSYMISNKIFDSHLYTDACVAGYGAVYEGTSWFYGEWSASEQHDAQRNSRDSMPYKELLSLVKAVSTFGTTGQWQGKYILFHSDCQPVVDCVKKGSSKDKHMMTLIRSLHYISATYDFDFSIEHIRGKENVIADLICRNELVQARQQQPTLDCSPTPVCPIPIHNW
jgi:hypothetical protein